MNVNYLSPICVFIWTSFIISRLFMVKCWLPATEGIYSHMLVIPIALPTNVVTFIGSHCTVWTKRC